MLILKRFTVIIVVSFLVIPISLTQQAFGVNTLIISTIGDLDGSGDSVDEDAVIQAAADCWDARITTNRPFILNITGGDLTGNTLGQGATTLLDGADVPIVGNIIIDNSNRTWYIDLTPNDNSEFTPDPNSQWRFINGPANSELYATVIHEIGHAQGWLCGAVCGFNNPSYELLYSPQPFVTDATCTQPFPIASLPPLVGCAHLTSLPYDVSLRGDGLGGSGSSVVNELSHPGVGGDLMEGFGASGQRETPSEDDVNMFMAAYGDTVNLPPSVDLGADIISECNATGGSNVSLDGTASTDPEGDALTHSWGCPGIALADANTSTPDGFFPLDSNTTCRDDVTDLAQCSPNAATVDVTVEDTTDPDIDCPDDITVECTATGGTPADDDQLDPVFDGVSATDVCDANPVISDDAPVFFLLGDTTVEFTATDDSANDSMCSEVVTVEDTTDPDISCPAAITVECTAIGGIPADDALLALFFNGVSATDICDATPVISDDAPVFFPLGDTTVEFTASDGSLNSAMCSEVVTVADTTAPVIQCNAPATIQPPDAPITFSATATDICDADPGVVITAFDCFQFTKKGKRIDKTESCQVSINGDSVTINNSGGVNDIIEWTVEATDGSGNMSTRTCSVLVVNPS